MRTLKFLSMACLLLALSACGGKRISDAFEVIAEDTTEEISEDTIEVSEGELIPESTEIIGGFEGCFTVVNRAYKPTDGINSTITVELERTDKPLPFPESCEITPYLRPSYSPCVGVGFGIEYFDKDGNMVDKTSPSTGCSDEEDAVIAVKTPIGKRAGIRFEVPENSENIVSFRITSAYDDIFKGVGDSEPED